MRLVVLTAMLSSVGCASSLAYVSSEEPPSPSVAQVLFQPREGHIWVEGHFRRERGEWVWVDGHYVEERPGMAYRDGFWQKRSDGRWHYVEGLWIHLKEGHVFARGSWRLRDRRLVWVPGYSSRVRPDFEWQEGRWVPFGRTHIWQVAHWRPKSAAEPSRAQRRRPAADDADAHARTGR